MHNRSDALGLGAIGVVPSFESVWFAQSGAGRQVAILVIMAAVAIGALLVAGAAYMKNQRHRHGSFDDEEPFTTTPLPMPPEEMARLARQLPHHAFNAVRIPRWVQAGTLLVALGITWMVAQRLGPNNRRAAADRNTPQSNVAGRARDVAEDAPEDLDLAPDSSPAFTFRARDWVARGGGGCTGLLEVAKGEPSAWSLTARVHDGQGQLIDTATARVAGLREGEVVEFSFPRADCGRIGAWDVRGARRGR